MMDMSSWCFIDEPSTMVITTKNIISKKKPILSVWHDADDGMWQFLDGSDVSMDDAMVVSMKEIVGIDESINEAADLPLGWIAWREQKGSPWYRQKENS